MKAKTYLQQLQKLDIVINQKLFELNQLQSELKRGIKPIRYDREKVQTSAQIGRASCRERVSWTV